MEQIRALNALEPFLALAKSANSPRAASDLITRATSQPTTFIFTELLLTPQIQALSQSPEHIQYLTLLQIFAYGTYTDYTTYTLTPSLPPLTEPQILKLRQLSLLTLARSPTNLTYKNLLKTLELNSARALEDLVISCIYAGLIEAKLDPYNQLVSITSVAPLRDISPNSVPSMIATFHAWSNRCTSTLKSLEHQIAVVKSKAIARKREELQWQQKLEGMLDDEKSSGGGKGTQNWDEKTSSSAGGRTTKNSSGLGSMLGSVVNFATGGGGSGKRGMGMGIDEEMDMDVDDGDNGEGRGGKQKKRYGL